MADVLYKVTFTFDDTYRPKTQGFISISLVVSAYDQFDALKLAWARLAALELPEPKSFNAERLNGSN